MLSYTGFGLEVSMPPFVIAGASDRNDRFQTRQQQGAGTTVTTGFAQCESVFMHCRASKHALAHSLCNAFVMRDGPHRAELGASLYPTRGSVGIQPLRSTSHDSLARLLHGRTAVGSLEKRTLVAKE